MPLPQRQQAVHPSFLAGLPRPTSIACALLLAGGLLAVPAHSQGLGISTQGNTGGLTIPSAFVLEEGQLAFSAGNYREPMIRAATRRNFNLGIGLFPYLELFGRFAEYTTEQPGRLRSGLSDLSPNVKLQLPPLLPALPNLAIGANDFAGGAVNFRSVYAVASDQYGPLRWSLGAARGRPIRGNEANGRAFDGVFGGVELLLGGTGLSALAEYDGQQKHAGLRYHSPALASLDGAQFVATLQRSFGASNLAGQNVDASAFSVGMVVPLGKPDPVAVARQAASVRPLPPLDQPAGAMVATREDRLESLRRALLAAGLERVRVGTLANNLVVEYENHRYAHNEADAIGIVLGLGAELAPEGIQRAYAVGLKAGLRIAETSVDVPTYRQFLRSGDATNARASLAFDRMPQYQREQVQWLDAAPGGHTPLRVEISPDVNYTIGTEVAAYDYSLAAQVQAIAPLWEGAELHASYVHRLATSQNAEPGRAFESMRQRNGLKVAALQQSFWLGHHVHASIGVGRYHYEGLGVQAESTVFMPMGDDVVRLKAGMYDRQPGQSRRAATPVSGSYRWVPSATTWLEAGWQQYSDGSRGPALVFTRWFDDVAVNLFFRRGGDRRFAGLELSVPLTPRRGMAPGAFTLAGTERFARGIRTRLTGSESSANNVMPTAVRDFASDYSAEVRNLNSGRFSQAWYAGQLPRMREAFHTYARALLPG